MKRKKRECLLMVLCCCLLGIAGCGQGEGVSFSGNSFSQKMRAEEEIEKERALFEEIENLNNAMEAILAAAPEGFFASYQADRSFVRWLSEEYGEDSIFELQKAVGQGQPDVESWYQVTGKSIHVLWTEYGVYAGLSQGRPAEKIYEKECAEDTRVVLDFTGDINLAEGWSSTKYLDRQLGGIQDCFSPALMQEIKNADILMINNEFTFSTRGTPLPGKAYTFRAAPERVSVLLEMGADIVSLANNHVYDYGEEALLDTLDVIEQAQIPYVGAGRNLEEAMKPVYFIANGRRIAVVAATQIERSSNQTKEATDTAAGVLKTLNPDKFLSVIEQARAQSDYVIAFVHWGTENTNHYESDQTELGKVFINAGADVVIGGHTHCLQGFDYQEGKPIVYSLGNFWFNNRTIDTGISQVVIHTDDNRIDFRFLPCIQQGCVTSLVEEPGEKQRILAFMQRISAPGVLVDENGNVTQESSTN